MKPSRVLEVLKTCVAAKRPTFLWGPPGVGKSDVMRLLARQLDATLVDVRALLLDPVDFRGIPQVTEENVTRWAPPAFLPRENGPVLLFLDELNAAPPLTQAACYQLVLDRRIGEYTLPENAIVVAAGNRESDRAVVSRMPTPLANRFVHIDFEVDNDEWLTWARENGIQTEITAFIRWRPELLHKFDPQRNEKAFPTPRSWEFVSQVLSAAKGSFDYDLVEGIVGEGAASEFVGFLETYRNLPDIDEVIKHPDKAEVSDDPATLYAISGAIAQKANSENFANVVAYVERLPVEFSVLTVRESLDRDETLVETRAFIEWTIKHKDFLV